MIQQVNNQKNVAEALLGNQADANAIDPELMLENAEFANELAANMQLEGALKVQPVEVNAEAALQSPSGLIKLPEAGQPETVNPKIFDPALTQGVEKLIQPKTTKVPGLPQVGLDGLPVANVEAANIDPEIAQAMLKTPQIQSAGRAPAIDSANAEIDPQLMNMEDFVAQKNIIGKKPVHTSAYGMHKSPGHKAAALENGLKSTQTVGEAGLSSESSATGSSVNSQQFLLGLSAEGSQTQKNDNHMGPQAPVKTFDMSHVKTDNPDAIMNQISDYIVQAKAAKEPTVNMRVKHEELGVIDITVQKSMPAPGVADSIAINIGTHSADGKNFFQMNSKDLFSHLTSAGLNVSDLKVETPTQTAKNDFDFGSQSRGGSNQNFHSESNQRRQESERRQELWNLLKDKEAA